MNEKKTPSFARCARLGAVCAALCVFFSLASGARAADKVLFFFPLATDTAAGVSKDEAKLASQLLLTGLSQLPDTAGVYDYAPDSPIVTLAVLERRLPRQEILKQLESKEPVQPDGFMACRYARALKMDAAVFGTVTKVNGEIALRVTVVDAKTGRGGEVLITSGELPAPQRAPRLIIRALKKLREGSGEAQDFGKTAAEEQPAPKQPPGERPAPEEGGQSPKESRPAREPKPPAASAPPTVEPTGGRAAPSAAGPSGASEESSPSPVAPLSANPEAQAMYEQALRLRDSDLDQAIIRLEQACQLDANSSALRVELARFYLDAGRKADALAALRQALAINPSDVQARRLFAQVRGEQPSANIPPSASLAELQRLKLMYPLDVDVCLRLAELYEERKDWRHALQELRDAAAIRTADPDIQLRIGQIAERLRLNKEAEKAYLQAAEWSKDDPAPRKALAAFYARRGRFAHALEQYMRAAALSEQPLVLSDEEYAYFLHAVDAGFAELFKVTEELQKATQAIFERRGQTSLTREELYLNASQAQERLKRFAEVLEKTIAPPARQKCHSGLRVAAKLLVQAGVELLVAIDTSDRQYLSRSKWSRNQAMTEALAARKAK